MKRLVLGGMLALLPLAVLADPAIGETPPSVTLADKDGGRVTGEPWSSDELKGKVHVVFYVDPDEKSLNDHVGDALKEQEFPREQFASVAIINMKATWLPNRLIESSLKEKQEQFPTTTYVKDFRKVLVERWDVADNNSDVLLFAPDGRLVFYRAGKLSDADVAELINTVRDHLPAS